MWGFPDPLTRPSYIVFTFLPISFLTGVTGAIYLWLLDRKEASKSEAVVMPTDKDLELGEDDRRESNDNDATLRGSSTQGRKSLPAIVRDNWTSEAQLDY